MLLKFSRSSTATTEAWPCTMPAADGCISKACHRRSLIFVCCGRCQCRHNGQQRWDALPVNKLHICRLPRLLRHAACVQRGLCSLQPCSTLSGAVLHITHTIYVLQRPRSMMLSLDLILLSYVLNKFGEAMSGHLKCCRVPCILAL